MEQVKYFVEKCFWGDKYYAEVYEEHKGSPGFAPEYYEVKVCEIWLKYTNWERRIYFNKVLVDNPDTLKLINKIFNSKRLNKNIFKRIEGGK